MLKKFFEDKEGRVVITQWPNPPLIVWILALLVSKITQDTPSTVFAYISTLAITVWAVIELGWGRSMFRRVLGMVVMAAVLRGILTR